jgi:hypothetical protein
MTNGRHTHGLHAAGKGAGGGVGDEGCSSVYRCFRRFRLRRKEILSPSRMRSWTTRSKAPTSSGTSCSHQCTAGVHHTGHDKKGEGVGGNNETGCRVGVGDGERGPRFGSSHSPARAPQLSWRTCHHHQRHGDAGGEGGVGGGGGGEAGRLNTDIDQGVHPIPTNNTQRTRLKNALCHHSLKGLGLVSRRGRGAGGGQGAPRWGPTATGTPTGPRGHLQGTTWPATAGHHRACARRAGGPTKTPHPPPSHKQRVRYAATWQATWRQRTAPAWPHKHTVGGWNTKARAEDTTGLCGMSTVPTGVFRTPEVLRT